MNFVNTSSSKTFGTGLNNVDIRRFIVNFSKRITSSVHRSIRELSSLKRKLYSECARIRYAINRWVHYITACD